MGLDSYLWKKTSMDNWVDGSIVKYDVSVTLNGKPVKHIDPSKVTYIIEEVGYWRKANQIHNWFVQNVQNGVDDCKPYWVDEEELQELLKVCKKVIKKPSLAESLLPTSQGFFFGRDDYDEYYMEQLKYTVKLLEKLLKLKEKNVQFEYQSSW